MTNGFQATVPETREVQSQQGRAAKERVHLIMGRLSVRGWPEHLGDGMGAWWGSKVENPKVEERCVWAEKEPLERELLKI